MRKATKHRTARGKEINMNALAKQHELDRAVSNVPINARGDVIDNRGKIVRTREEVAKVQYAAKELPQEKNKGIKEDPLDAYNDDRLATKKDLESMSQKEILDEMSALNQEIDNAMGNPDDNPMVRDHNKEVSRKKRKRKGGGEYYEVEWADGSITEEDI